MSTNVFTSGYSDQNNSFKRMNVCRKVETQEVTATQNNYS